MTRPTWAPPEVDLELPSSARVYDYMLGGSHNFASDRRMAEQLMAVDPRIRPTAFANRAFLRRTVEYLAGQGVEQYLDLGSGIPTVGNVHEIVRPVLPASRVAYVDLDPVAVAHSRAIVGADERVTILQADVTEPDGILDHPAVRDLLDLGRPVAVLMVAILHFIPESADAPAIIARLRDRLAPGSQLVISQAAPPDDMTARGVEAMETYRRATPITLRGRTEVEALFAGFELAEPGVTHIAAWRPEPDDSYEGDLMPVYGGVGVKP